MPTFSIPNNPQLLSDRFRTRIDREGLKKDPQTLRGVLVLNAVALGLAFLVQSPTAAIALMGIASVATLYGIWRGCQFLKWRTFNFPVQGLALLLVSISGTSDVPLLVGSLWATILAMFVLVQSPFILFAWLRANKDVKEIRQ